MLRVRTKEESEIHGDLYFDNPLVTYKVGPALMTAGRLVMSV